jgi:hypothetical protein
VPPIGSPCLVEPVTDGDAGVGEIEEDADSGINMIPIRCLNLDSLLGLLACC